MDDDALDNAAWKLVDNDDMNQLTALAPFLSDDTLKEIADKLVKTKGIRGIKNIIPFL